jgi:superkiller protein 3
LSRFTLDNLLKLQTEIGIVLLAPEISLRILLGTSLIHYQSPKHHPQAQQLFDTVLSQKPNSVEALVGKGRIAVDEGNFSQSIELTSKALLLDPVNVEAKMEHGWALALNNNLQGGRAELEDTLHLIGEENVHSRELIAEIWWKIGKCVWEEGLLFTFSLQILTKETTNPAIKLTRLLLPASSIIITSRLPSRVWVSSTPTS